MFPLDNGILRLTWSVSGPARRVLTRFRSSSSSSSDSLSESLLALSVSLDDTPEPRRSPPRSRVGRGELGRANACSILSALEERSRLKAKILKKKTSLKDLIKINFRIDGNFVRGKIYPRKSGKKVQLHSVIIYKCKLKEDAMFLQDISLRENTTLKLVSLFFF